MTDRYAVIGNPVAHSRSPEIHAAFARQTGQDIEYLRLSAPIGGFAGAVEEFRTAGGRGANVTVPFKEEAFHYCTSHAMRARSAGVVNTLSFDGSRVLGENTDGAGLVRDLLENIGVAFEAKRVLLLGAGGAARGVIGPLLEQRPATLAIVNRTPVRSRLLAAQFPGLVDLGTYEALAGECFDIVVNATSASLAGVAPPLPPSVYAEGALAYDMMYAMHDTPFLAHARAAGARIADGIGMLVEQAAESFFIWRGVRPGTRAVLDALRKTPQ
jgi:shikimate dehydrogenase